MLDTVASVMVEDQPIMTVKMKIKQTVALNVAIVPVVVVDVTVKMVLNVISVVAVSVTMQANITKAPGLIVVA